MRRLMLILLATPLLSACELTDFQPQDQETQDKIANSFRCMWLGGCE